MKNVPLSADDGIIERTLNLYDCDIEHISREKLRVDGRLTNCETGDRLVISKIITKPLPRFIRMGRYNAKVYHQGQPQESNTDSQSSTRVCHKCLQPGHLFYNCENDWVCKLCKQPGHKVIDCPQSMNENIFDDDMNHEDTHAENTVDEIESDDDSKTNDNLGDNSDVDEQVDEDNLDNTNYQGVAQIQGATKPKIPGNQSTGQSLRQHDKVPGIMKQSGVNNNKSEKNEKRKVTMSTQRDIKSFVTPSAGSVRSRHKHNPPTPPDRDEQKKQKAK